MAGAVGPAEAAARRARRRLVGASLARFCVVVGVVSTLYVTAPLERRADGGVFLQLTLALLILLVVVVWEIREIIRSPYPELRGIEAVAVALPLLLLPFAAAYIETARVDPASFSEPLSRLDAVYFTITVFTTVGFGDIVAQSQPARAMVTAQMVADLVLIGFIAKVLFGAVQRRRAALGGGGVAEGPVQRTDEGLVPVGDEDRQDGSEDRDQDGGEQRGEEAVDAQVTADPGGDAHEGGVHDQREQAERQDR